MIPNDRQRTNASVDQSLVVKERITASQIFTNDLTVTGTSRLQGPIHFNNFTVSSLTATDVVATSVTTVSLMAAKEFLTNTINQLTLGTGNVIVLSAPTPASSRTYTIPDVGADASFVMTDGAQTIHGVKTFTSTAVFLAGFTGVIASLVLTNTSNQLTMGTGQTITLNAPTPAVSRIYTTPDVGLDANFIMSEGNQTINGIKTFTSNPVIPGLSLGSITLTNTSNQLFLGTGQIITVSAPTPLASQTYTMPDVKANASFVMTEGDQTINGTKTFTSAILDTFAINQFVLGVAPNTVTINAAAPAAPRIYTMPNIGADASFVMTEGNQTINGTKTFTSAILDTVAINQFVLGSGNTVTFNAAAPAASRIYTAPDVLANANFIMSEGAQTINGAKTFSSTVTINPTTNQLVLGITNTTTINSVAPAASRTYTIQDVLANANFIMSEGAQTINGVKTFTSAPVFPALSFASLTLTNTSNQLTLGTGATITLTAPTPAGSVTYTLPDASTNANFILSEGVLQTINGSMIFAGDSVAHTKLSVGNTVQDSINNTDNTNANSDSVLFIRTGGTSGGRPYVCFSRDLSLIHSYAMGIDNVSGDLTIVTGSNVSANIFVRLTSSGVLSFPSGLPSLALTNTTNQLLLGTINTVTINSVAPAASRIYTIPDAGADASFVLTAGTQTVGGAKTFSSTVTINPTTNQLVLGVTNTTTINSVAPAASRTYSIQDVLANANFIMSEGAQTINGVKTFTSAPVFPALSFASLTLTNTTNQLVLGTTNTTTINSVAPAASRTYTIPDAGAAANFVMSESSQTLNGQITFTAASLIHTKSNAGADVINSVTNSDNTNGASNAVVKVITGGASGGDPKVTYDTGVTTYAEGIDNSDSDAFVRCVGTALGTTNYERVDSSGRITYPTQPIFIAYKSSDTNDQTGDGTNYTIIYDTEVTDVGNNYNNATGTFTAPITGIYWFEANVLLRGLLSTHTQAFFKFVVNGNDRLTWETNTANLRDSSNTTSLYMSRTVSLTAAQTVTVVIDVANGTKVVDIGGDAGQTAYFSGRLIC